MSLGNALVSSADQVNAADINAKVEHLTTKMAADWTNLPDSHNLSKFSAALPSILSDAGYNEMYGVTLSAESPVPHTTLIILQKYLRANMDDLEKAKEQLSASLKWRKEYQPLKAKDEVFAKDKFGSLGFVTRVKGAKETPNEEDVVCFNIYGLAAKEPKKAFGDTEAFFRWRVALQELVLSELSLSTATQTIPDYGKGPDPYKAINVHDYLSVSFFSRPKEITTTSKKIVEEFQKYYPETTSYKYFVNVPIVMQWMMGAMKSLMSKDSIQTMTWMSYGSELHKYLGDGVPKEYGGSGASLEESGITPKYEAGAAAEKKVTEPAPMVAEPTPAVVESAAAVPEPAPAIEEPKVELATDAATKPAVETAGKPAGEEAPAGVV